MRLDNYLVANKYFETRTKAKQAIERGEVYVNGKQSDKPSLDVTDKDLIEVKQEIRFVSIGGYKLEKAFNEFNLSVDDKICVDIGASTGGFTDCLLKRNAQKVYAVDLNDALLHKSLKENEKVVPLIKNAKDLKRDDFSSKIDFICADLSFISATQVLPIISSLIDKGVKVVLLIKPQFELDKKVHIKNGIIKEDKLRQKAIKKIEDSANENHLTSRAITETGFFKDKNTEYLILLEKTS